MAIYSLDKTENFIIKSKKVKRKNNVIYDYSETIYNHSQQPVVIVCPIHGRFEQLPSIHLSGGGCPKCFGRNKTTEDFIKEATIIQKEKNGDTYNYKKTIFISSRQPVKITCFVHGKFEQTPDNHLHGQGCPYCAKISRNISKSSNIKDFTEKLIRTRFILKKLNFFLDNNWQGD